MESKAALHQFEEIAGHYVTELDRYSLEQFRQKPAPEEWSLGQMYHHLLMSLRFQLGMIEKCAEGTGEPGREKTGAGKHIFHVGEFPDMKIKLPDRPELIPENPTDKKEVKEQLLETIEKIRELEPKIASISTNQKAHHPALGWLNATEWFQLIPMHFRHHLRQKERLDQWVLQ
ncbi:DinB family protein [Salinithrix halophila]|uniref:DinB family protein n=1 Tax=Salinithrix halophila TaxID=1485204 RepID=A0ABV8JF78_9BACL